MPKAKARPEEPVTGFRFCDFSCEYAAFPDSSALTGDCHRAIALYCRYHKRLVPKNNPCLGEPDEDTKRRSEPDGRQKRKPPGA